MNAVNADPWAEARAMLDMPDGMLNIAYEAVDRPVMQGHGDETAILWLGKGGNRQELTYGGIARQSSRFANVLAAHGLAPDDGVLALLGRVPDLCIAAIGTPKAGIVFTPPFSVFGPEPIRTRMEIGAAKAALRREGRDLTLITYGGSLLKTLQAAEGLASDGIEAEVIDLRSLRPLDDATLLATVAKTRRALIVDEGWRSGSLAAEVSARIMEQAFWSLDAPVGRVCSQSF